MDKRMFANFENGQLAAGDALIAFRDLPWNEHPDFKGVFLKNIVPAESTGGLFTCHLVRIEPGMKIGMHTHPASVELHEVVAGEGKCITELGEIHYAPGQIAVLPEKSPHEVQAGKDGLCLFAKFVMVPN